MSSRGEVTKRARPTPWQWFFTSDGVVLTMVTVNSLVLFLLAFEPLAHVHLLRLLDYSFTTYFVAELVCKVRMQTLRGFLAQGWNRFDSIVVLLSLPSYALLLFEIPDLSFLLLLRAARTLKFLRVVRFVPEMPKLVDGAKRALRASSVVVLGFFVFNFIISLVSYHLFHPYSPEHFGNPLLALYSTFKVFTVEGWYEIPDTIAAAAPVGIGVLARAYFMIVVIGGGLLGLSLVNAIFVDEMLRDENNHLESQLASITRQLDDVQGQLQLLLRARSHESREPGAAPGRNE